MKNILETKRLLVREFCDGDSDILYSSILGDSKVMEYSLKGALSKKESKEYLETRILQHYCQFGYGLWALISKKDKSLVGLAGPIQQNIDGKEYVEIGYRIAFKKWGKGYATEAVRAIRDYAFLNFSLDEIVAIIDPKNINSEKVAKKTGMKKAFSTNYEGFNVDIYKIDRITIAPFSKDWKALFEKEVLILKSIFKDLNIQFFHIGSTSIPNCFSKPKIDILGVVDDITKVDQVNKAIEKIGYESLGEFGIKQRRFFTRNHQPCINLHVFEKTDPEMLRHLRFCNFLRKRPKCVEEYSEIKRELISKYPADINQYCLGKEAFIKSIDYMAAKEGFVPSINLRAIFQKKSWSKNEIIKAMTVNMHLQMTYFAKYLPMMDIIFEKDVTVVISKISDDTFNYVIDAQFEEYNVKERIKSIVRHYKEHNLPFSWWVSENDTPDSLPKDLSNLGFRKKEDDIGMYLPLDKFSTKFENLDLIIKRVKSKNDLEDFANVYSKIGGYNHLYQEIYRLIPLPLIQEGACYEMYIGYIEGLPAVTGLLVLHANVAGIYYLMTEPNQRSKGYGSSMMKHLLKRAKEKGHHLAVLSASKEGRSLYKKLGFQSICSFLEYSL